MADSANPFNDLAGATSPFPAEAANPFDNYVDGNSPFATSSNVFAGTPTTTSM